MWASNISAVIQPNLPLVFIPSTLRDPVDSERLLFTEFSLLTAPLLFEKRGFRRPLPSNKAAKTSGSMMFEWAESSRPGVVARPRTFAKYCTVMYRNRTLCAQACLSDTSVVVPLCWICIWSSGISLRRSRSTAWRGSSPSLTLVLGKHTEDWRPAFLWTFTHIVSSSRFRCSSITWTTFIAQPGVSERSMHTPSTTSSSTRLMPHGRSRGCHRRRDDMTW
mmetsp:Transcript_3755/g.8194  ORF Transcript_3755/g.8194 Transcript_3755/m.8194 type:complete len:221 (+) Transcript_3755:412-1074(+)